MTFKKQLIFYAFSFSLLLIACDQPQSQSQQKSTTQNAEKPHHCIEKILTEDNILGEKRNHDCEAISLSSTIQKYADGLQNLDFTACPESFTTAFQKHRQAWLDLTPFTESYPELRGEMHDLFDVFEKGERAEEFKPLLKAIWDTWGEIEQAQKDLEGKD